MQYNLFFICVCMPGADNLILDNWLGVGPQRNWFSFSQHPLTAYNFSPWGGALWDFPHPYWCDLVCLYTVLVWATTWLICHGCSFSVIFWRHNSVADTLVLCLLRSFWHSLSASIRVGYPIICYSLHFNQLWFSLVVSICHPGWNPTFSYFSLHSTCVLLRPL